MPSSKKHNRRHKSHGAASQSKHTHGPKDTQEQKTDPHTLQQPSKAPAPPSTAVAAPQAAAPQAAVSSAPVSVSPHYKDAITLPSPASPVEVEEQFKKPFENANLEANIALDRELNDDVLESFLETVDAQDPQRAKQQPSHIAPKSESAAVSASKPAASEQVPPTAASEKHTPSTQPPATHGASQWSFQNPFTAAHIHELKEHAPPQHLAAIAAHGQPQAAHGQPQAAEGEGAAAPSGSESGEEAEQVDVSAQVKAFEDELQHVGARNPDLHALQEAAGGKDTGIELSTAKDMPAKVAGEPGKTTGKDEYALPSVLPSSKHTAVQMHKDTQHGHEVETAKSKFEETVPHAEKPEIREKKDVATADMPAMHDIGVARDRQSYDKGKKIGGATVAADAASHKTDVASDGGNVAAKATEKAAAEKTAESAAQPSASDSEKHKGTSSTTRDTSGKKRGAKAAEIPKSAETLAESFRMHADVDTAEKTKFGTSAGKKGASAQIPIPEIPEHLPSPSTQPHFAPTDDNAGPDVTKALPSIRSSDIDTFPASENKDLSETLPRPHSTADFPVNAAERTAITSSTRHLHRAAENHEHCVHPKATEMPGCRSIAPAFATVAPDQPLSAADAALEQRVAEREHMRAAARLMDKGIALSPEQEQEPVEELNIDVDQGNAAPEPHFAPKFAKIIPVTCSFPHKLTLQQLHLRSAIREKAPLLRRISRDVIGKFVWKPVDSHTAEFSGRRDPILEPHAHLTAHQNRILHEAGVERTGSHDPLDGRTGVGSAMAAPAVKSKATYGQRVPWEDPRQDSLKFAAAIINTKKALREPVLTAEDRDVLAYKHMLRHAIWFKSDGLLAMMLRTPPYDYRRAAAPVIRTFHRKLPSPSVMTVLKKVILGEDEAEAANKVIPEDLSGKGTVVGIVGAHGSGGVCIPYTSTYIPCTVNDSDFVRALINAKSMLHRVPDSELPWIRKKRALDIVTEWNMKRTLAEQHNVANIDSILEQADQRSANSSAYAFRCLSSNPADIRLFPAQFEADVSAAKGRLKHASQVTLWSPKIARSRAFRIFALRHNPADVRVVCGSYLPTLLQEAHYALIKVSKDPVARAGMPALIEAQAEFKRSRVKTIAPSEQVLARHKIARDIEHARELAETGRIATPEREQGDFFDRILPQIVTRAQIFGPSETAVESGPEAQHMAEQREMKAPVLDLSRAGKRAHPEKTRAPTEEEKLPGRETTAAPDKGFLESLRNMIPGFRIARHAMAAKTGALPSDEVPPEAAAAAARYAAVKAPVVHEHTPADHITPAKTTQRIDPHQIIGDVPPIISDVRPDDGQLEYNIPSTHFVDQPSLSPHHSHEDHSADHPAADQQRKATAPHAPQSEYLGAHIPQPSGKRDIAFEHSLERETTGAREIGKPPQRNAPEPILYMQMASTPYVPPKPRTHPAPHPHVQPQPQPPQALHPVYMPDQEGRPHRPSQSCEHSPTVGLPERQQWPEDKSATSTTSSSSSSAAAPSLPAAASPPAAAVSPPSPAAQERMMQQLHGMERSFRAADLLDASIRGARGHAEKPQHEEATQAAAIIPSEPKAVDTGVGVVPGPATTSFAVEGDAERRQREIDAAEAGMDEDIPVQPNKAVCRHAEDEKERLHGMALPRSYAPNHAINQASQTLFSEQQIRKAHAKPDENRGVLEKMGDSIVDFFTDLTTSESEQSVSAPTQPPPAKTHPPVHDEDEETKRQISKTAGTGHDSPFLERIVGKKM